MYIFEFTASKQGFSLSVVLTTIKYTSEHLPTRPILDTLVSCKQINWDNLCNAIRETTREFHSKQK